MIFTKKDPKEIISKINKVATLEIVAMNNNETQYVIKINNEQFDIFRFLPLIRGQKIIYDETYSKEEIQTLIVPMGVTVDDVEPTIMSFDEFLNELSQKDEK